MQQPQSIHFSYLCMERSLTLTKYLDLRQVSIISKKSKLCQSSSHMTEEITLEIYIGWEQWPMLVILAGWEAEVDRSFEASSRSTWAITRLHLY